MGSVGSRDKSSTRMSAKKDGRRLKAKMKLLREEISGVVQEKEKERVIHACKEAGWKEERKKMREEVKMLRKTVEETKAEKVKEREGEDGVGERGNLELGSSTELMVMEQQMREERARRDETVERWKQLYLAIKIELDHLIQRTHDDNVCSIDGVMWWREGDVMEELKAEIHAREETIKTLRAEMASMEDEKYRREREIDILRQSLRIMSSN